MEKFQDNPFNGELEVIETLRDRSIEASIAHTIVHDELLTALQYGLRIGISVDALSVASGLTTGQIRSIEQTPVNF